MPEALGLSLFLKRSLAGDAAPKPPLLGAPNPPKLGVEAPKAGALLAPNGEAGGAPEAPNAGVLLPPKENGLLCGCPNPPEDPPNEKACSMARHAQSNIPTRQTINSQWEREAHHQCSAGAPQRPMLQNCLHAIRLRRSGWSSHRCRAQCCSGTCSYLFSIICRIPQAGSHLEVARMQSGSLKFPCAHAGQA